MKFKILIQPLGRFFKVKLFCVTVPLKAKTKNNRTQIERIPAFINVNIISKEFS